MIRSLWTSATGMQAQELNIDVISNNLANVNTNGFKRDQAVFEDLMYQTYRQVGSQSSEDTQLPSGKAIGTGVRVVATEKLHTQGNIVQTSNPLDIAIEGRGFFQILKPDGSLAYSRDGSFQLDSQGQIVTANGYQLQPTITVPSNAHGLSIGEDGVVTVLVGNSTTPTQLGNIQLADFVNPTGLQAIGNNLFNETAASGSPQVGTPGLNGVGSLSNGALESSNVNVVEELVNMIETQRAYEMNSKVISTTDGMLQYVTNNL